MGNRTKHTSVLHRRHGKRVLERALQVAGDRVCRARGLRLEALLHLEFQTVSGLALLMRCQQATPAGHRCARGSRVARIAGALMNALKMESDDWLVFALCARLS